MKRNIFAYRMLETAVAFVLFCVLGVCCVYARTKKERKAKKSKQLKTETVMTQESDAAIDDVLRMAAEDGADEASKNAASILEANNGAAYKREEITGDAAEFNEVWAFYTSFYKAEENRIDANAQVTDIALFGAEIGSYGDLQEIPPASRAARAKEGFAGKVHLTFACSSRGVTHFCLSPKYDLRAPLLNSIIAASRGFDGVVCDLENIGARDKTDFLSFLKDLKAKLGKRMLTVCVSARTKPLSGDIFPYREISDIADRVFIMAYDEHWSTSKPGPVASYRWCAGVADYAVSIIPKEKLIMGIPFYARAWVDKSKNPVGAWRYSKFMKHLSENGVTQIERTADGDGHVKYSVTVDVDAYFDDAYSLYKKCIMYQAKGITGMGVWCIGQDDAEFWKYVKVK